MNRRSNSGAALPDVTYRFTENFSASFGLAGFFGRQQGKVATLYENSLDNRATSVPTRMVSATR